MKLEKQKEQMKQLIYSAQYKKNPEIWKVLISTNQRSEREAEQEYRRRLWRYTMAAK